MVFTILFITYGYLWLALNPLPLPSTRLTQVGDSLGDPWPNVG